jgi:predicted nucleotidyltransferase
MSKFKNEDIILSIKNAIKSSAPEAVVILYGSFARGENRKDSDLDLLILIDKDKISFELEKKVKYPLYDIEFETGQIISPLVLNKKGMGNKT